MRALRIKVTCGAEDAERCNQAFTVAAAAIASGADVGLWLTGEAAWFGVPGKAEEFSLPLATPLATLRDAALETGFVRCKPGAQLGESQIEFLLTHNTGFAEVYYGTAGEAKLEIATDAIARTATAKDYAAGKRLYGYVEGDLLYAYDMAAMGQALQPHTWARLQRQ
jgi:predicted peroxiredoxin